MNNHRMKDRGNDSSSFNIQEDTAFLVMKTARMLRYRLDKAMQEYGITAAQFSVMNLIGTQNDTMTSAEIAFCLRADRPTISGILRRLEEKGHLTRRMHPEDRRAEILRLSDDAMSLLQQIRMETDTLTTSLEQSMTASQLSDFRHSLTLMLSCLEREES